MFKTVSLAFVAAVLIGTAANAATATVDLNMRSGPGIAYRVVGVIPINGSVAVTGCVADSSWCMVDAGGLQGWASSAYLANDVSPVVTGQAPVLAAPAAGTVTTFAATSPIVIAPTVNDADAASQGHSYDVFPSQDSVHFGGKYP